MSSNAPGGYYFVVPWPHRATSFGDESSYNIILDSVGNVVYYRPFPRDTLVRNFSLHSNGTMSYFNAKLDMFLLEDSAFTVIDSISDKSGDSTDAHVFKMLTNGHYLMLSLEKVDMDLSHYFFFGHGSQGVMHAAVFCSVIVELDKDKNVVFEWHAKDHFSFDSIDPFYTSSAEIVDWTHCNALDLDYDGNILLSTRNFNEITKINRKDGSIIWRLGGKYNQFKFVDDTVPFYGQHDIRRLANGNITLFDDGHHTISHGARALEYKLDETNKTAQLVWSYTYDSSMYVMGSGNVQRLTSGATLINYGELDYKSKDNICFSVVDNNGVNVFKFLFTGKQYSYRAYNYPALPWRLNRPEISCFESGDTLYLDAGRGHGAYQWSNGSTGERIAVTKAGTFYVFVPYGQGGYISSEKVIVTDIHHTCDKMPGAKLSSKKNKQKAPDHPH